LQLFDSHNHNIMRKDFHTSLIINLIHAL